MPPGGKTESEGGIEGADYFRGEEAAFAFVCAHPELFREGTTLDDIKAQELQTDDEDEGGILSGSDHEEDVAPEVSEISSMYPTPNVDIG